MGSGTRDGVTDSQFQGRFLPRTLPKYIHTVPSAVHRRTVYVQNTYLHTTPLQICVHRCLDAQTAARGFASFPSSFDLGASSARAHGESLGVVANCERQQKHLQQLV